MRLSRESEYGLRALLFLAEQPADTVLPVFKIASASGLPRNFLAKIFQKLVQHGLVKSFRGATRGYALARPPTAISIREVLDALEGPGLFERCVFWGNRCGSDDPCPLHEGWRKVKPQLVTFLEETTLDGLARDRA